LTKGIEATTGPLGQGIANAVGMALAEKFLAAHFNREDLPIIDHYTYALHGDGCLMEGISYESASLAGSLGLSKLILLYDSNDITIEGSTSSNFTEDVGKRFESMGWQVLFVSDANQMKDIDSAISAAKQESSKPSILIIKSKIGYGSPRAGTEKAHGEPLGEKNITETKQFLNWNDASEFFVPEEVTSHIQNMQEEFHAKYTRWQSTWENYQEKYPDLAAELKNWFGGPQTLQYEDLESFLPPNDASYATRSLGGEILNHLTQVIPNLIGGSADLNPSTKTYLVGKGDFHTTPTGQNIHFGVREHAMGGIVNGIAYHGGLRPFASTFFVFSDYMKPSIRLSALSKLPVVYIFTHDSIGVGEDGPTHQPVEHLAALRSMPGIVTFRPADKKEVLAAYLKAFTSSASPYAILLTRQNLPTLPTTSKDAGRGAYIVLGDPSKTPQILLIASGSELSPTYEAGKILEEKGYGVRVVSMPSPELFEMQDPAYKKTILPDHIRKRISVEAGSSFGWHKYLGLDGIAISLDRFGESAPANTLFEHFGFTTENIVKEALKYLGE
jgi:transketolase